jgi:hypothetical protein
MFAAGVGRQSSIVDGTLQGTSKDHQSRLDGRRADAFGDKITNPLLDLRRADVADRYVLPPGLTRWSHALCLAAFVVALSRPPPVSQLSATSPTVTRPADGGT